MVLVWGSNTELADDRKVCIDESCPACGARGINLVMIKRVPHIFFIPISFFWIDKEPAIHCKSCKQLFVIQSKMGNFVEQFYSDKISKKELLKRLKE